MVVAGELQAVEEDRGAAGFKPAEGEGLQHVGDGELDGCRVFKEAQVELHGFVDDAARHFDVARPDGGHADEVSPAVEGGGDELGRTLRLFGELALLAAEGGVEEAEVVGVQGRGFAAEAGSHGVLAGTVHA